MIRFLQKLTLINASVLTVTSFFIVSLLGGLALWVTEKDRQVNAAVPFLTEVSVKAETDNDDATHEYDSNEVHTFIKNVSYQGERFIDTWFTSVSALCVTGLTSTDFSQFTPQGQVVVLILIQAGGLGIILFTSIFAMMVFRGVSERIPLKKLLGAVLGSEHHDVADMVRYVIVYTFIFEFVGTLIMGIHLQFFADKSLLNGINPWWWSLFHSVSAFNNAGFGLMNNNLVNFVKDPVINTVIGSLIVLGGIGYPVLIAGYYWFRRNIVKFRNPEKLEDLKEDISGVASSVQIRVAIVGTVILLLVGTIVTFFVEYNNAVIANYNFGETLMVSLFQSVSTRTAGFNTVDIGAFHIATLIIYMALMFIGANPAGTAGGIKIPTIAVLYGYIKDWFMAPRQPVMLLGRAISKFAVSHAIRLFFFSVILIGLITFGIALIEQQYLITPDPIFNFMKILFEVVSAFGTVGLSMGFKDGVTSFSAILSDGSKILMILVMLIGRVGPLTLLEALPWKREHENQPLSPDYENSDRIQIG